MLFTGITRESIVMRVGIWCQCWILSCLSLKLSKFLPIIYFEGNRWAMTQFLAIPIHASVKIDVGTDERTIDWRSIYLERMTSRHNPSRNMAAHCSIAKPTRSGVPLARTHKNHHPPGKLHHPPSRGCNTLTGVAPVLFPLRVKLHLPPRRVRLRGPYRMTPTPWRPLNAWR